MKARSLPVGRPGFQEDPMKIPKLLLAAAASALVTLPAAAAPAIVKVWDTPSFESYKFLTGPVDLNGDGTKDLVTQLTTSHGLQQIQVRSAAGGTLLAQSQFEYDIDNGIVLIDLDGDDRSEIIFLDGTSRLVCLQYLGTSPLNVRWSITPFPTASFMHFFADFDANGHMYVAALGKDPRGDDLLEVYDRNGQYFSEYLLRNTSSMTLSGLALDDFDGDSRDELMMLYNDNSSFRDSLILLEPTTTVAVEPGRDASSGVALGATVPNPANGTTRIDYSIPTRGPVELRVIDVTGREVRTLVQGEVPAGRHDALWDGRDGAGRPVPAGAYFYELNAAGRKVGKQIIRLQ
jgi:hypothetical protein